MIVKRGDDCPHTGRERDSRECAECVYAESFDDDGVNCLYGEESEENIIARRQREDRAYIRAHTEPIKRWTMIADEVAAALEKHLEWLNGEEGGERADLFGAALDADYAAMKAMVWTTEFIFDAVFPSGINEYRSH